MLEPVERQNFRYLPIISKKSKGLLCPNVISVKKIATSIGIFWLCLLIHISWICFKPVVDTCASFPYTLDIPIAICCQSNARESVLNQQSNYALHAGGIINSDLKYRNKFGKILLFFICPFTISFRLLRVWRSVLWRMLVRTCHRVSVQEAWKDRSLSKRPW